LIREDSASPDIHLLAFAPLLDETTFTAENHKVFILSTLDWYHLDVNNLVCLIGDNCSTNGATANLLGVPLLGCRSHRLNLAVEAYIAQFLGPEVELVSELMSKLSTLKEAGRLRLSTSLRPVKRNKTHWLGVIKMLQRYERLLPSIDDSNPEVAELLPSPIQRNKIRDQIPKLLDFKDVTESLQRENITIGESQVLLQSLIHSFPEFLFESYIGTTARIVHSRVFEDAIVRIQSGNEHELLQEEKGVVHCLLRGNNQVEDDNDVSLSFSERALKRQRLQEAKVSSYVNTGFLLPTSNHVERLFSQAKRLFSTKRQSLLPKTLEALIFLKENRQLWNTALVSVIVNDEPDHPGDEVESDSETESDY
jgi:hypothetical protein